MGIIFTKDPENRTIQIHVSSLEGAILGIFLIAMTALAIALAAYFRTF